MPLRALTEAIRLESGGDAVMQQILADTAATTLPSMLRHDGQSSNGTSLVEQVNGDPEDIFGEAAAGWADLAFAQPERKRGESPASHQQNSDKK